MTDNSTISSKTQPVSQADGHDLGFSHDLPTMIGRRRVLTLLAGLGAASVSGLPAAAAECVALPWETAGPFPADGSNARGGEVVNVLTQEGVIREDLRGSFAGMTPVAEGVPLDLVLTVEDADGCAPLEGRAVYIWHCDAAGDYSLYNRTEANYLRGVGVTDADGTVRFTTIVPGCYAGRWPHIHFEVYESAERAVDGGDPVLTAQIALPKDKVVPVYRDDSRYDGSLSNLQRISLSGDNVFGDNTDAEIAQQTLVMQGDASGYRGTVTIPVDYTAGPSSMAPPPGGPGGPGGDGMPPPPGMDGR